MGTKWCEQFSWLQGSQLWTVGAFNTIIIEFEWEAAATNKAKWKRDCRTWIKLVGSNRGRWQQWRQKTSSSNLMETMRRSSENGPSRPSNWSQKRMGQGIDQSPKNRSKKCSGCRQEVSCNEWLGLPPFGDVMHWQSIFLCASSPRFWARRMEMQGRHGKNYAIDMRMFLRTIWSH